MCLQRCSDVAIAVGCKAFWVVDNAVSCMGTSDGETAGYCYVINASKSSMTVCMSTCLMLGTGRMYYIVQAIFACTAQHVQQANNVNSAGPRMSGGCVHREKMSTQRVESPWQS